MPEQITSYKLLKTIDKLEKVVKKVIEAHNKHGVLKKQFLQELDEIYSGGWEDVDLRDRTIVTTEEAETNFTKIHNPTIKPKKTLDDIEVNVGGEDNNGVQQ